MNFNNIKPAFLLSRNNTKFLFLFNLVLKKRIKIMSLLIPITPVAVIKVRVKFVIIVGVLNL